MSKLCAKKYISLSYEFGVLKRTDLQNTLRTYKNLYLQIIEKQKTYVSYAHFLDSLRRTNFTRT